MVQCGALTALRTLALCGTSMRPAMRASAVRLMSGGFSGPRQQQITQRLTDALDPVHLEVINTSHGRIEDESHFKVVVVSEAFEGKRLVGRHRAVNSAVMNDDGTLDFHSLEIGAAKTPAEWSVSSEIPDSPRCMGGDGRGMTR